MKQQDSRLRMTNVSFLNSAPFRIGAQLPEIHYEECEPAECARRLHEEETDLALIPLVECFASGAYDILDFGIVASGAVESVVLLADCSTQDIKEVFVDGGTQTSLNLLKLFLIDNSTNDLSQIKFSRIPKAEALKRVKGSAAALVIGEHAHIHESPHELKIDLAKWWHDSTGLPFVFAAWAARKGTLTRELVTLLRERFEFAIAKKNVFAREWAMEHGRDPNDAERYITECIHYHITPDAIAGMKEFHRKGFKAGLFPRSQLSLEPSTFKKSPALRSLDHLLSDASNGIRLSVADGLRLANDASLHDLSMASDARRQVHVPGKNVSYIVDRNINYTNVCNVYCRFCAFYRAPGKKDGYTLSKDEIGRKIQETVDAGGIQILLQGGLNPELGIEYYEDLFSWITSNYPVNLHALSADEIVHIQKVSNLSFEEVFQRLIAVGLRSFPGGGAEILVDRVRKRIARLKTTASTWLEVHRTAHRLGLHSTCTMMFGVQETWNDRFQHMLKLRQLQDETGGFTAFITWPFQEDNTKLKRGDTSAPEYLRVQSLSRLFLDNITHIQSSWVTMGPSIGQIALFYGADDFGSVMFEENVVSAAGTVYKLNNQHIERHILEAGFVPWQRNVLYQSAAVPVTHPQRTLNEDIIQHSPTV